MKPILLGIPGLEYQGFTECETDFLLSLMNSIERGVSESAKPQYPDLTWWSILMMEQLREAPKIRPEESPLVKLTRAVLINIPISNPTYGIYSIPMDQSVGYEEEVSEVIKAVAAGARDRPVIASINAIERYLHTEPSLKCQIYNAIDNALKSFIMHSDISHIIIFSPYGNPEGPQEGMHSNYGVYLGTINRPRHEDTVKPHEIGYLFNQAVEELI
ncbi:hypothetical protein [Vulcanisaeta thermophila]|uniref:hypothetical protein n=1 Tax=Vulcanisaeta thermophila TaxID=867917 RepID=UPI00085341B7|nr:hypothetical protein [Vulcanisaeta thermophila]